MTERLRLKPKPPEPVHAKRRVRVVYKSDERLSEERRVRLVNALLRDMKTADGLSYLYASLLARTIVGSSKWIAEQVGKKLEAAEIAIREPVREDDW